jgi:hypothetical protein
MRRAVVPLALVLALVSGVVLAEARLVVLAPIAAVGPDPQAHAGDTVVRRFYAAANTVLRTGDPAALDAAVALDLVEHSAEPPLPPTRAGLARSLLALRAAFPRARLAVEGVVVQASAAAARVRVDGLAAGDGAVWGPVDLFRWDGDRVVEHWGAFAAPALPEPLAQVPLAVRPPAAHTLLLQREAYPAGAGRRVRAAYGARLLCVEAGALSVLVDPRSPASARVVPAAGTVVGQAPAGPGEEARLADGACVLFPEGAVATVANAGTAPATALRVEVVAAGSTGTDAGSFPTAGGLEDGVPGAGLVRRWYLAGAPRIALPVGAATLTLARRTLAPGEAAAQAAPGPVLVAVEAGQLALAGADGTGAETRLGTGDGALVPAGPPAALRNSGGDALVVLVLTIAPAVGAPDGGTP